MIQLIITLRTILKSDITGSDSLHRAALGLILPRDLQGDGKAESTIFV